MILSPASDISALVITFNEEGDIRRCLESLSWSNDVVVLDSGSTDRTQQIARQFPNVRVIERSFDDIASQRNHGLHSVEYRNEWVFLLDADECCTSELHSEVLAVINSPPVDLDVMFVRRAIYFFDREMKWNSSRNVYVERVVRPARVMFEGKVHEKLRFDGTSHFLSGFIDHRPFSKGIENWMRRRNQY